MVVKFLSLWYNNFTCGNRKAHCTSNTVYGGIAQLVRALASHARGRRFESYCPYQNNNAAKKRRCYYFAFRKLVYARFCF